ncbi:hypothetical protein EYZ11_012836 [Aspergillus tanneri]|uniref:DUF7136 domain-containing protein n=1 Tax=Aspergillus tanneri TaxID=1220188 RepID=A0A4S3IZ76_9EURO|nr:uncharacterized protein ATNIH1004_001324 [Aspergillus tanneri]KAA8652420.1 hypothetical protein ATNIH1004_001324 [Aspergillus tanneri]THC87720.1 hypothetical protein EYZ11_012836 [Aspergillus tanneri]
MHFSRASWLLSACMGAMVSASSVLEMDLVFPRNETYAPTELFPIIFAFQNAERAKYLNPHISYTIRNWDNRNDTITRSYDLRWTNWSSHDPYFAYTYFSDFSTEGRWKLDWSLTWESCDEYAFSNSLPRASMIYNSTSWGIFFTIQNAAPKVDLVTATANKTCPGEHGVAIKVTDKTMEVPLWVDWPGGDSTNNTCAVVASSTPMPIPDPCRVDIDSAIAASMSASLTATLCKGVNPPADCPEDDENAAQQLAVFGVSLLLAAFGALSFFLM